MINVKKSELYSHDDSFFYFIIVHVACYIYIYMHIYTYIYMNIYYDIFRRYVQYIVLVFCSRLTKREKHDISYKSNVLKLAKEHKAAKDIEQIDRYYLPKDDVMLTDKYVEDTTELGPNHEQKRWEEQHFSAGYMRFGARDAHEKSKKPRVEYDVIMDDEIDFVQALKMPGTNNETDTNEKV